MLSTPLFSMQVLDRVLSSQNTDTLLMLTLVIILALSLLGLIQAARAFAMNKMGAWLEDKLSEVVFSNSIRLALESKAMANSQQLRDLQTVKTFLTSPGLISINGHAVGNNIYYCIIYFTHINWLFSTNFRSSVDNIWHHCR